MKQNHKLTSKILSRNLDKEFINVLKDDHKYHPEDKFRYLFSITRWVQQYELSDSALINAMFIEEKDSLYSLIVPNISYMNEKGLVISYHCYEQKIDIDGYNSKYYGKYSADKCVCRGYDQCFYNDGLLHITMNHLINFYVYSNKNLFDLISINSIKGEDQGIRCGDSDILVTELRRNCVTNIYQISVEN